MHNFPSSSFIIRQIYYPNLGKNALSFHFNLSGFLVGRFFVVVRSFVRLLSTLLVACCLLRRCIHIVSSAQFICTVGLSDTVYRITDCKQIRMWIIRTRGSLSDNDPEINCRKELNAFGHTFLPNLSRIDYLVFVEPKVDISLCC